MYSEQLEMLIDMTIEDGVVTDKEMEILKRRAEKEGIDPDELEMYVQYKLKKAKQSEVVAQKQAEDAERAEVERKKQEEENQYNYPVKRLKDELWQIEYQYDPKIDMAKERWDGSTHTDDYQDLRKECCARKMEVVKSAMTSTSRRDLLELLLFAKNLADPNGKERGYTKDWAGWWKAEDLSYGYWVLLKNCVKAAHAKFPDDPEFKVFIDFYNENATDLDEEIDDDDDYDDDDDDDDVDVEEKDEAPFSSNQESNSISDKLNGIADSVPGGKLFKKLWGK